MARAVAQRSRSSFTYATSPTPLALSLMLDTATAATAAEATAVVSAEATAESKQLHRAIARACQRDAHRALCVRDAVRAHAVAATIDEGGDPDQADALFRTDWEEALAVHVGEIARTAGGTSAAQLVCLRDVLARYHAQGVAWSDMLRGIADRMWVALGASRSNARHKVIAAAAEYEHRLHTLRTRDDDASLAHVEACLAAMAAATK